MKAPEYETPVQAPIPEALSNSPPPVLIYDGLCVMCNAAVNYVLRNDRDGTIRFAPLQGEYAAGVRREFPELEGIDSIVFVTHDENGRRAVSTRSDAAIAVSRFLKRGSLYSGMLRVLPRQVRDVLYDAVAAVRYRIFGRHAVCPIPPERVRHRFLA